MSAEPDALLQALKAVLEDRRNLTAAEAAAVMDRMLDAGTTPEQSLRAAALLGALTARGETIEELAGFVQSLRLHATPIPLEPHERALLVDTCGTGGDASGTFNISTAAGLVAAAAGAWVAKHGNRAVTSSCGSADVLEALGIPVDHTPTSAAESLRRHHFAFLPAPALQPAMRAVMPIRRALGTRTAFNILGPMSNPAGATAQVLGVYAERLVMPVAETLARLGTRHALVVHGSYLRNGTLAGMDEISLSGPTLLAEVRSGTVSSSHLTPASLGLAESSIESLQGTDAPANAAILRAIFAGEPGPRRDVVVLNAGAVLLVAGLAPTLAAGVTLAQQTIDSGAVTALVSKLSTETN